MDPNIKAAINTVYLADIEAIRNLSSIATKLVSNGGLTFTGNFDITGNSTISGNSNVNGNKTISGNLSVANNKFNVDSNGTVTCSKLKLGNWTIYPSGDGLQVDLNDTKKIYYFSDGEIWTSKLNYNVNANLVDFINTLKKGDIVFPYLKFGRWSLEQNGGSEVQFRDLTNGSGTLFGRNQQIFNYNRAI